MPRGQRGGARALVKNDAMGSHGCSSLASTQQARRGWYKLPAGLVRLPETYMPPVARNEKGRTEKPVFDALEALCNLWHEGATVTGVARLSEKAPRAVLRGAVPHDAWVEP